MTTTLKAIPYSANKRPPEILYILDVARDLAPGGRTRGQCPKCKAEGNDRNSCSIYRRLDAVVQWRCWRASCSFHGTFRLVQEVDEAGEERVGVPNNTDPFFGVQNMLPQTVLNHYWDAYDIQAKVIEQNRLRWTPEYGGSVVVELRGPWWDPMGSLVRGHLVRPFPAPIDGLKARIYTNVQDAPRIGWIKRVGFHGGHKPNRVIVVEDFISALKVAQAFDPDDTDNAVVTLNGTNISPAVAWELGDIPKVSLALDKDAFAKSVKMMTIHRANTWKEAEVWKLDKDLKYVDDKRLRLAIYDGKSDFSVYY